MDHEYVVFQVVEGYSDPLQFRCALELNKISKPKSMIIKNKDESRLSRLSVLQP